MGSLERSFLYQVCIWQLLLTKPCLLRPQFVSLGAISLILKWSMTDLRYRLCLNHRLQHRPLWVPSLSAGFRARIHRPIEPQASSRLATGSAGCHWQGTGGEPPNLKKYLSRNPASGKVWRSITPCRTCNNAVLTSRQIVAVVQDHVVRGCLQSWGIGRGTDSFRPLSF